ncbi:MAG: YcxB family protein [Planctomycetota bacterium]|jgi:hypothetical protein
MVTAVGLVVAAVPMLPHRWPLASVYLALTVMLLILRGPWRMVWIRRRFRSRPDKNKQVRYRFDESGIHGETDGLAKTEIDWSMPVDTLVHKDTLLIFVTPRQYLYVPLGAEREALLELVRSKLG